MQAIARAQEEVRKAEQELMEAEAIADADDEDEDNDDGGRGDGDAGLVNLDSNAMDCDEHNNDADSSGNPEDERLNDEQRVAARAEKQQSLSSSSTSTSSTSSLPALPILPKLHSGLLPSIDRSRLLKWFSNPSRTLYRIDPRTIQHVNSLTYYPPFVRALAEAEALRKAAAERSGYLVNTAPIANASASSSSSTAFSGSLSSSFTPSSSCSSSRRRASRVSYMTSSNSSSSSGKQGVEVKKNASGTVLRQRQGAGAEREGGDDDNVYPGEPLNEDDLVLVYEAGRNIKDTLRLLDILERRGIVCRSLCEVADAVKLLKEEVAEAVDVVYDLLKPPSTASAPPSATASSSTNNTNHTNSNSSNNSSNSSGDMFSSLTRKRRSKMITYAAVHQMLLAGSMEPWEAVDYINVRYSST